MAVVTPQFLQALFTNYRALWEDAFLAASSAPEYERYCTIVPSTSDRESYNWLGTVPKMREWIDERQLEGLAFYNYEIINKHWESSIEVDRNTLEDDKYMLIAPRIQQLGVEAARYPSELATDILVAGTAALCYDGQFFFDTDHNEEESGDQDNDLTGTGVTLATVRADFITARTAMHTYVDGRGRPMNLQADAVMVEPTLRDVWEQLVHTNMIALSSGTQQSNVLLGAVDILVNSYLSDVDNWYLFCTTQVVKPLIFQNRKNPEFVALDRPDGDTAFRTKQFMYGADARYNAGYGLWQMAILTTN